MFAFAYFSLALAPALGMVDMAFFSNSRVADHFQYLALPGITALIAALARHKRLFTPTLAVWIAAAVLGCLTCRHEMALANERTLWEDNLAKNPNSWKVCMNLSVVRLHEGKTEEAIKLKDRAEALLHPAPGKPK